MPGAHRRDGAWPPPPPGYNSRPYLGHHAEARFATRADIKPVRPTTPYPYGETTPADHTLMYESTSRLRQPAYLGAFPGAPFAPGRHRAPEPSGPPPEWPPYRVS
jgi:hypothetical protein